MDDGETGTDGERGDAPEEPAEDRLGFETRAVGPPADPERPGLAGDAVTPLHLSATYEMDRAGEPSHGYKYARLGNPTRDVLEERLADLDDAAHGMAFASGTAATAATCMAVVEPDDRVVAFDSLYGGTRVVFEELLVDWLGAEVVYVDATDPATVAGAATDDTALVWMETPTNPLLKLCDLPAVAEIADRHDAVLAVDNTFASPYRQRPLELGADVVPYSTTKFVNGHSDSVGGAVVTDDDELAARVTRVQEYVLGAPLAPADCYLVLRGLKTLPARMERHERNARRVAAFLADHDRVRAVHYPGLESHPQYDLAAAQMDGFGGVVSFELDADGETTRAFVEGLDLFRLAVSLGGVESLVEHPASMSASYISPAEREAAGITESLVRAPVGIEDPEDLVADLARGLDDL